MEQTSSLTTCPNCQAKLTGGFFQNNQLVAEKVTRMINEFSATKASAHCGKCHLVPYGAAKEKWHQATADARNKSQGLLDNVLVVSIPSPIGWDYEVLGLVTGQSTTGTGIFSEFTSSITDLFGAQSGAYNKKINAGEQLCMAQIRLKCLELGGNAIIGADIDYAEVGGDKGMLMVCMTGTAIKLKNTEALGTERVQALKEIQQLSDRMGYLHKLYYSN